MIGNNWDNILNSVWESEGFKKFCSIVKNEYSTKTIFPPKNYVFNALKLTPYENVKVVIMGQDPYHGVGEASSSGDLTKWAKEGVLLLNAVLTVEKDKPASHKNLGWEYLTDYIIQVLNKREEPIVFILWGNFARDKKKYITNPAHLIIESAHPSPFSCNNGFFGSKPFSRANKFLEENNIKPIDWKL